jgi:hypothetical protein
VTPDVRNQKRRPPPKTVDALWLQAERQQRRTEELDLGFNVNWTMMEPEEMHKEMATGIWIRD